MHFSYCFTVALLVSLSVCAGQSFDFPGNPSHWYAFDDNSSGGDSKITQPVITDSSVMLVFQLRKKEFLWPYVGLGRTVNENGFKGYNPDDSLIMEMSSNRKGRILLKLSTFDPELTKPGKPLTYRILEKQVTVTSALRRIAIPLKEFNVADWWKQQNEISPEDNSLYLDSLCYVEVIVNDPLRLDHTDTVIVRNMDIISSKRRFPVWTVAFVPFILVGILLPYSIGRKKIKTKQTSQPNPRKITASPSDWEKVVVYMEKNYMKSDLSIGKVASDLGFSESKLSHLIGEHFCGGFRAFIHEMRVQEAKRLLKESGMNITEIAYKLGYATPSHFNREFKKRTSCSPSKYKNTTN